VSTLDRTRRAVALALLVSASAARGDGLEAGFGAAPLPAPAGGVLGGYGGVFDRTATGVLDPPEARALVLASGPLRVGIVALDLVIARPALADLVAPRARSLGLDPVILVATHTHSGPGGYMPGWIPARVTAGSYDPNTPRGIADAAADALALAVSDLAPARVASGETALALARNRRLPDGPRETALPILRLEFADRPPIVAFAYGAHPTVLSRASRRYSADYPGPARARLDAAARRALFLPGPLGDQEPAPPEGAEPPESPDAQAVLVGEIGRRLADAVLAAEPGLAPAPDAGLALVRRTLDAPAVAPRRGCAFWWLDPLFGGSVRAFLSARVPFHALRVGDALLLGVPGEPTAEVASALRERLPRANATFVIAHAEDWLGYVVSHDAYARGGYEACLSFHGPGLAAWLVDEAAETARLLDSRAPEVPAR
jgi:hypothetical protein